MDLPGRKTNELSEQRPRDFASLFLDNPETPGVAVDPAVWHIICQNVPREYTIPDKVFLQALLTRK